jgi:hypothetical protein
MKGWTIPVLFLLWFGVSMVMCGCHGSTVIISDDPQVHKAPEPGPPPWAPAHGHRAKHKYYYYPATYIYFDVGRSLYFYYHSDQWRVSASLPVGIRINVAEYMVLEMDDDKPYKFHSEVAKRYPPGQQKKLDKENDKEKGKGKGKRD